MAKVNVKVADFDSIYNAISNGDQAKYSKLVKQAAKIDSHPYWMLLAKMAKKIGYGALKMDGDWYPVIAGELYQKIGYQHSTAACAVAAYGIRSDKEIQHLTSI